MFFVTNDPCDVNYSSFSSILWATMKVAIVLAFVSTLAAFTAAAPAIPIDQPVQLVVVTTKALKALGVHFPHQHRMEVTSDEMSSLNSPVDSNPSQKNQWPHHKIRHSRGRHRVFKCPQGMKKDSHGKCRRIFGHSRF
ncbi:hypothetical protein GE061_017787 [Apolygus lucorum]|uniref:Uncharacterized protein n=1 Tax=Apolygus lucorum TaxID=248454 RepID=A0A8S9XC57_APOLU|nr:hypothetical protein GE061_017787 [Apolygus lucorum]